MKAAVFYKYGPPEVVQIKDVDKPVPAKNEILVKVHATTVSAGDWRVRRADPFLVRIMIGLWKPKKTNILGLEFSGEVEQTGESVKRFKKGDKVFSMAGFNFGAHAEYICIPENSKSPKKGFVAIKPDNMSFEEAAAVPGGGLTALGVLKKANIKKGQKVMVYGASGAVGTAAVQFAKYLGAEITGVCSGANIEMVKSLGADWVIDYTKEDFTKSGDLYDLVFDAVDKTSRSKCRRLLKKNGKFLSATDSSNISVDDLVFMKELIEKGKYHAVIDRIYPFEQIVEAHHYVESWRKKGSVVIKII